MAVDLDRIEDLVSMQRREINRRISSDPAIFELEMEHIFGKFLIDCIQKFTVDNLFDWYHPMITHMSAMTPGVMPAPSSRNEFAATARPQRSHDTRRHGARTLRVGNT